MVKLKLNGNFDLQIDLLDISAIIPQSKALYFTNFITNLIFNHYEKTIH